MNSDYFFLKRTFLDANTIKKADTILKYIKYIFKKLDKIAPRNKKDIKKPTSNLSFFDVLRSFSYKVINRPTTQKIIDPINTSNITASENGWKTPIKNEIIENSIIVFPKSFTFFIPAHPSIMISDNNIFKSFGDVKCQA